MKPGSYGVPCKFFKYGDCSNGDKCPYLHNKKMEEGEHKDTAKVVTEGTSTPDKQPDEEEKVASPVADASSEELDDQEKEEDVTELKDFISKEEELYYYGAPGEFEDAAAESAPPMPTQSYVEVTKKNVKDRPLSFDEERPAPPRMVTRPERKKVLIDVYRKNLSGIPCRHFDEGRGTCPFGTSCFYAHRYPDGTLASRQVRTAVDSDGQYDVLRQIRLENFLKHSESNE
ncbi:hypothetical protein AM588_10001044 [Phytophthora nicotianae]|uniref:C3H1-type domain-containing protein n=1 Tax=Phytophthora nicotianae TaxID=4792 RepID=A0A0W8CPM7_PHYNI|nr:hypothetical protein AM588_10001044 [Phytophthora nicotianae]